MAACFLSAGHALQAELDAVEQATTALIQEMEEAIAEAGRFIDAAG